MMGSSRVFNVNNPLSVLAHEICLDLPDTAANTITNTAKLRSGIVQHISGDRGCLRAEKRTAAWWANGYHVSTTDYPATRLNAEPRGLAGFQ